MKSGKDRSLTIRISLELYQEYMDIAIQKSVKENRIIKISEVIRETLENNLENEKK